REKKSTKPINHGYILKAEKSNSNPNPKYQISRLQSSAPVSSVSGYLRPTYARLRLSWGVSGPSMLDSAARLPSSLSASSRVCSSLPFLTDHACLLRRPFLVVSTRLLPPLVVSSRLPLSSAVYVCLRLSPFCVVALAYDGCIAVKRQVGAGFGHPHELYEVWASFFIFGLFSYHFGFRSNFLHELLQNLYFVIFL
ncbi:nucleoside diphosphate kinase, partial [Striga asiatica]